MGYEEDYARGYRQAGGQYAPIIPASEAEARGRAAALAHQQVNAPMTIIGLVVVVALIALAVYTITISIAAVPGAVGLLVFVRLFPGAAPTPTLGQAYKAAFWAVMAYMLVGTMLWLIARDAIGTQQLFPDAALLAQHPTHLTVVAIVWQILGVWTAAATIQWKLRPRFVGMAGSLRSWLAALLVLSLAFSTILAVGVGYLSANEPWRLRSYVRSLTR